METTMPTAAAPEPLSVSKYKYKVFDGFTGERYLESLAQKFAPLALFRTWHASVSFQAPGESCYVGVSRLIDERPNDRGIHVGVKERKVHLDLEAMEARGWLRQQRILKTFKTVEGHLVTRAVPDKDFSGFYDTAYAYHLWLQSAEYVAPERENIDLILADPALVKRLIRFENYRRLLLNAKPGRKASPPHKDFYSCQLEKLAQKGAENGQDGQHEPKWNLYFNTSTNEDSLYRILENNQSTKERGFEDSTSGEEEQVVTEAIRNFHPKSSPTPTSLSPSPNPNPESPSQEEKQGGAAAKEEKGVLGYTEEELKQDRAKRGAALAGIPADQYAKLNGGLDHMEQQEAAQRQEEVYSYVGEQPEPMRPARPEREVPSAVIEVGRHYARQYDDAHLIASDVTRLKKLYSAASQAVAGFEEGMYWERFDAAKEVAAKRAKKCTNSKGFVTRVPYLFTCLENSFAFSLEELVYLRGDDVLYSDSTLFDLIDHLRETYHRLSNTGQIDLEYRTWLCDILDEYEKRKEPKERLNPTAHTYA